MAARWIIAALILRCCLGKRVFSTVTIGGPNDAGGADALDTQWKYLSKFGYDIGTGTYGARFKFKHKWDAVPASLSMEVHLDEDWDVAQRLPACERTGKTKRVLKFDVPSNGTWSEYVRGSVKQAMRPHVWYFALRDCQQALPEPVELQFELYALQEGDGELSVEVTGTLFVAAVKILLGTAFLAWFCMACAKVQASAGALHPVIQVLAVAAVAQYAAWVCYWLHLWVYKSNGYGVRALDIMSEGSSMLSQILLTSLSILLAQGYTILPGEQVRLDVLVPLIAVIVVVHIAIVAVSKLAHDDAHTRFHENDGFCGALLVGIRLALFAWFLLSMQASYRNAGSKLLPFLRQFGLASSLHYMSYPLLVGIASLFAPYVRHKVMFAGLFLMQAAVLGAYTSMFLTRGLYFQVSQLGGTFLPTPQGSRKRPQLFGRGGKAD